MIKDCGLFRNKARAIVDTSRILLDEYDGEVPKTREELMKLPGVGRKTANVVMSTAFGIPAMRWTPTSFGSPTASDWPTRKTRPGRKNN